MIRLVAVDEMSGWAFAKLDDAHFLIHPPYESADKRRVSPEAIERAITRHDFIAASAEFPDWFSLVEHLDRRMIEARRAAGETIPDMDEIRGLARLAPPEVVVDYLDRIEEELFPNGEWDAADSLLRELLHSPKVRQTPDLLDRCTQLLDCAAKLKRDAEVRMANSRRANQQIDLTFRLASIAYGEQRIAALRDHVRANGSLLAA